ncbi:extensin-like domain-containing protein [Pseudaminobacter sp. NGMCC 1.201702]|uniref:extensin-like domain-containing protein n=1 Tax=Pseudaminobacter sp. NGMCC 1.201702 TaxID=3391825 RepID=UPI0039F1219B
MLVSAGVATAEPVVLPQEVPVPKVHAPSAGNIPPARLGDTPVPEPRPDTGTTPQAEKKGPPVPSEKPVPPAEKALPPEPPDPRSIAPRPATMPPQEKACRARLRDLGVKFEERPPLSDPAGCALPWPLEIRSLGKDIELAPQAVMNCAIAETAARFARDVISPAAKTAYGEELKSIAQASAYVCRPRNGSQKLSEHAFGNALDIARFILSKGTEVDVSQTPDAKAAQFLDRIRKAACGPFKTVLGPGSDADHSLHFHFDLAPRKNGGTFCQ